MTTKATNIVAYIGIIGWLIAFLAGDKEGAKFHLNQALVLNLASIICSWIPLVGWIIAIVIFVFWIMGIVAAIKDEEKELPLIGKIQILK